MFGSHDGPAFHPWCTNLYGYSFQIGGKLGREEENNYLKNPAI